MAVLSHERLTRQLEQGERGGVFFLFGEESHLKEAAARAVIAAHIDPATRDFNLDEVRGDVAPETLASLLQTPPLMAAWRVVVLRDAEQLAASPTARAILEDALATTPPGLAFVVVADISGSKAKVWDKVKKAARSVEFPLLSEADVPGWLMAWAASRGFALEPDGARALAAAIGRDLGALVRELEKLREYVGARALVTRADVERSVGAIPRQDRWEWIDQVGERRFRTARAGLRVLLDSGESGVGLVIALATQLLRIAIVLAGGRSALEGALPPHQRWLARRIEAQARRWTLADATRALDDLRRADRLLKSAPLSDTQVMEELLLRFEHAQQAAAA